MSVYDGKLNAMKQNSRLPTLRSMVGCIRGQEEVCQVSSTHCFVVNFAHCGTRNELLAVELAAHLLAIALANVLKRGPSVQHMHRLVVDPRRHKKLPIWGQQRGGELVAPYGATGRGTGLLDDGASRRLRTRDPVCSQRATCVNAMPSKEDGFMNAGAMLPVVGCQNMVVAKEARLRCNNSLGEFRHRPQRSRNICRAVFFFASIPIKTETVP